MSCATRCGAAEVERLMRLNRDCDCLPLDPVRLRRDMVRRFPELRYADLLAARPGLFAATAVFVCRADLDAMRATARAAEQAAALERRARSLPAPVGAGLVMSYDFHLSEAGPRLIEINTNAGGAFLAQPLLHAVAGQLDSPCSGTWAQPFLADAQLVEAFRAEWRAAAGSRALSRVVIVDDDLASQYLLPDMWRARALLQSHGIGVDLAEPHALRTSARGLDVYGRRVDLVYNRSTDFLLAHPEHATLRAAWRHRRALVSPAPEHHAAHANKHRLVRLGDTNYLRSLGLAAPARAALAAAVPAAQPLTADNADDLWRERRRWFFKPAAGYGSRAVYRGAGLTRRVWQQIVRADYVAQALVPPAQRLAGAAGERLKYDLRLYTIAGKPLAVLARVYQGQVTNFRTPGGGLAPVVLLDDVRG